MTFQGGLGNQLFQWAFGTALRAGGRCVAADTVRCRGDRPLLVGPLLRDWPKVPRHTGLALLAAERTQRRLPFGPARVCESGFGYDQELAERARPGTQLVGYFQSPRYFAAVADEVRRSVLTFLTGQLTPAGRELSHSLTERTDSVAIHVRRGDYVSVPSAAAKHGALDSSYYAAAEQLLEGLGLRGRTWFSDDLGWVGQHLAAHGDDLCHPGLTTGAGGEIALMASCRVRVVANSSFSWWAGFLGRPPSDDRPVVAPRRWFRDGTPAGDLVPDGWTRL